MPTSWTIKHSYKIWPLKKCSDTKWVELNGVILSDSVWKKENQEDDVYGRFYGGWMVGMEW